ncbi:carboxypeptidase-like regulatory domain-containing protein [Reichenbachiella sp. MALMAid0571]|uniref:carboxypeptidase-like regulatory domain-containing protein n=1 Tax=Reichenbachiella sp. MALMAid0571 TaxID=3143939 RepID=UPI0032DE6AED
MKKQLFLLCFTVFAGSVHLVNAQAEFIEISGIVLDEESNKPIQACNVFVRNRDIGTVANSNGEFSIKIPVEFLDRNLVFSNIGYESFEAGILSFKENDNEIKLKPTIIIMEELVVREAENILRTALSRIPENYSANPELMTTFYREVIKKNNGYVDISQGVLEVFKMPYQKPGRDQIKINKGFRSKDYRAQDTLVFKLMGGPYTMLLLDVVKNPGLLFAQDVLKYYDYELSDILVLDGKRHFEISFKPKDRYLLYTGKIYIEEKTLAISEVRFHYADDIVKEAGKSLIRDKPRLAKLTPLQVTYEVKYREFKGRWYLYYSKNELKIKCNWKKKLFNSTFHSVSEMVITDRYLMGVQPFEKNEVAETEMVFSEEAAKYYDGSFWENYTIIKPEDDIKKALEKIKSRKEKH